MKRSLIIITLSFMIAANSFSSVKIDKMAVINIKEVIEKAYSGKSDTVTGIKKERDDMQDKLNKMKDNIMKIEELKLRESDTSKKQAYQQRIDQMKQEYSDFYNLKNYQINKRLEGIQDTFIREIYAVVKKIAETEGYTIVLDAESSVIFYYTVDTDLTPKVIKYLEDKYGEKK